MSDQPQTTPKPPWRRAADRVLEMGTRIYTSRAERAAMRGGMGDAAGLCDAIARAQSSKELEAVAKLCGDEIWKMRNRVQVPHV
jgi:hypothetical protein